MFISKKDKYEDIGGKTSEIDKFYYETIIREVSEETNNIVNIDEYRLKNSKFMINKKSKYIVFFVKANEEEEKITS